MAQGRLEFHEGRREQIAKVARVPLDVPDCDLPKQLSSQVSLLPRATGNSQQYGRKGKHGSVSNNCLVAISCPAQINLLLFTTQARFVELQWFVFAWHPFPRADPEQPGSLLLVVPVALVL